MQLVPPGLAMGLQNLLGKVMKGTFIRRNTAAFQVNITHIKALSCGGIDLHFFSPDPFEFLMEQKLKDQT